MVGIGHGGRDALPGFDGGSKARQGLLLVLAWAPRPWHTRCESKAGAKTVVDQKPWHAAQVEDMLKRSFLEFHAQKAAPEAAAALARGQSALAALRAKPWPLPADAPGCSRGEVQEYVAVCGRVDALSRRLQVCWP